MTDGLKAILQADVAKVDIHLDFNNSAVGKVDVQFKGIPETFEYEYEDTSVHSMKINKLDAQLKELGSALVNKINKMAQAHGLIICSMKGGLRETLQADGALVLLNGRLVDDWLKDDLTIIKDAQVFFNGKVVGKYVGIIKDFYDATQLLFNYIEIESNYKFELSDEPIRITITGRYGKIYQDINGYLTEIRKLDNNKVLIVIKQEIIDF